MCWQESQEKTKGGEEGPEKRERRERPWERGMRVVGKVSLGFDEANDNNNTLISRGQKLFLFSVHALSCPGRIPVFEVACYLHQCHLGEKLPGPQQLVDENGLKNKTHVQRQNIVARLLGEHFHGQPGVSWQTSKQKVRLPFKGRQISTANLTFPPCGTYDTRLSTKSERFYSFLKG